jgi:hypothetical protein
MKDLSVCEGLGLLVHQLGQKDHYAQALKPAQPQHRTYIARAHSPQRAAGSAPDTVGICGRSRCVPTTYGRGVLIGPSRFNLGPVRLRTKPVRLNVRHGQA